MQLSKSFYLAEFLKSETAARMGRKVEPTEGIIANLKWGCENVLEPIRTDLNVKFGKDMPMTISSGYRPDWLNKEIGGSKKSDHMYGMAADTNVVHLPTMEFAVWLATRVDKYPIKQMIYEFGEWVHISWSGPDIRPKREILTAIRVSDKAGKRRTVYKTGIYLGEGGNLK